MTMAHQMLTFFVISLIPKECNFNFAVEIGENMKWILYSNSITDLRVLDGHE